MPLKAQTNELENVTILTAPEKKCYNMQVKD